MGCGVSRIGHVTKDGGIEDGSRDLKLNFCKLTFTHRQLSRLDRKFENLLDRASDSGKRRDKQAVNIGVVAERLMQRLVCNVGKLDPRFSSKFLITLEPLKNYNFQLRKNLQHKYLVRLDLVSSPAIYPEFFQPPVRVMEGGTIEDDSVPRGYAKIRVHGQFLEEWLDFVSPHGFLRRDKIQERFLELLAKATARPAEPLAPKEVDESRHCGSPGKVVDPITLHHILQTPSSHQFFFGSAESNESRFPDPRDFRIAIVEGSPETRLHVSFLSPAARSTSSTGDSDVEISIVLGIGVKGWPSGTDFPFRLPLDHVDVILGYQAAQLDYYLVPKGPHPSIYCLDRTTVWEIRALASEMFLLHHYSPSSVIFRVYKILVSLLEILRSRGIKTVNRYVLKTLLFFELEQKAGIQQWAPRMIPSRVLSILDRLLACLRCQNIPSYVFAEKNLLLREDVLEDDCVSDGDILENYLKLLSAEGRRFEVDDDDCIRVRDRMENVMLQKWESVMANMLPPASNRSTRLSIVGNSAAGISYTRGQMEYVALLIRQVLEVKKIQGCCGTGETSGNEFGESETREEREKDKEDFVHLLRIMFEQAKQKLLSSHFNSKSTRRREFSKIDQIVLRYDVSTAMILDEVRRTEMDMTFSDDVSIVARVLECLYKAIDSDGRILGPVLRPYLNQIFRGSHENCWFLPEWRRRTDSSEIHAMEAFGRIVLTGKIDPLDGIINAAGKRWNWANTCLQIIRTITEETSTRVIIGEKLDCTESGLRLIFTPEPEKTIRFNVTTMKANRDDGERSRGDDNRQCTVRSFQDLLDSVATTGNGGKGHGGLKVQKRPLHILLRDGNPFAVASMEFRRQGNHRGLGSIIQALISLQKLTVLQEISQYLPDGERARVLSDIKKLSKEVQRLTVGNRRRKCFSPTGNERNRFSFNSRKHVEGSKGKNTKSSPRPRETYRSINEFAKANEKKSQEEEEKIDGNRMKESEEKTDESLMGTCRLLRKNRRRTTATAKMATASALRTKSLKTYPRPARRKNDSAPAIFSVDPTFRIRVTSFDSQNGGEIADF